MKNLPTGLSDKLVCSPSIRNYFLGIEKGTHECYKIALEARRKGKDPALTVEIPLTTDLASRVESLVGPPGIADTIRDLAKKFDRETLAIETAKAIIEHGRFKNDEEAMYQAIRTGLAIITEGVLVAPLEGVIGVKIKKNADQTYYPAVQFAGPIRSAGATGQALSVLIADIVRRSLGLGRYIPTPEEIERYKEEMPLYRQAQHLQYTPSGAEVEQVVSNCPVCIDGEGTDTEVSGYRNLPRVDTNRTRGGACLVIAEGMVNKASKVLKHVDKLGIGGWEFLSAFKKDKKSDDGGAMKPSAKYMKDIIAGRPVFSHPSRAGGFRLRYGKARTTGLAATAIHPATMVLMDSFLAVGTQIKIERPGKAGAVTPCDSIEGPIVLLQSGDLIQINEVDWAYKLRPEVKEIIDLGEILIPFGEFVENNHALVPGSFSVEWWQQLAQEAFEEGANINPVEIPGPEEAFEISGKYGIPLHPEYNLFWHDLDPEEIRELGQYIQKNGRYEDDNLILPSEDGIKKTIIKLGALHIEVEKTMLFHQYALALVRCCGMDRYLQGEIPEPEEREQALQYIKRISGITVIPRAPTRIGARMGRPEKAKERKMKPPPHCLFPIGRYGGAQRLVKEAASKGKIRIEVGKRKCRRCGEYGIMPWCECGGHTVFITGPELQDFDLGRYLDRAKAGLGESTLLPIKGVQGMISETKTPEALEKGILRAKHGVYVFKDGTIRFDMTDTPITHFKPGEIGLSVEKALELGYDRDHKGEPLESADQLVEIRPQDFIASHECGIYLLNTARFVDDLLVKFYGLKQYYNVLTIDDLVGHLVVGLAPHTSAGIVGRLIGYVPSQVGYAHPFYHAAKRRNCDGDEDSIMLLLECLLNFSRGFLPEKRGGQMDAPLVMCGMIDPNEIDKEAQNLDCRSQYPKELYQAAHDNVDPKDIVDIMDLVSSRIGKEHQYEGFGFTHGTSTIYGGPKHSSYKTLGKMEEKMEAQLELARKIRAVDVSDVAARVIESHFLPDLVGNLRQFSMQVFRCTNCNKKFRRIPLKGNCLHCGEQLTLTVYEKGVKKYLEITKRIADKYNVPEYTKQRVLLVEKAIDSLFENDKVRKSRLEDFGLGGFM
jgi:DNA polymerase II large subunit